MITSCEAQFFPQSLSFDRVLADVPCSGDGTSRKNIGIWKQWNQLGALALHSLQFDIAWKGCALLKVGGYICYSTCSQNPVENEAVVAELLRRANGSLELVDKKLEGFKTRPGISTWKVLAEEKSNRQMKNEQKKNNAKMRQRREEFEKKNEQEASVGDDKKEDGEKDTTSETNSEAAVDTTENETNEDSAESNKPRIFQSPDSWDEETLIGLAESAGLKYYKTVDDVPDKMKKRIRPSCFPPTEEEAKRFHLEKCLRCLPQDNDTGGFFTALLKKVGPISNKEARMSRRAVDEKQVEDSEPELKKAKPNPEIESDGLDRSDAMTTEEADDLPAGDDDDDDDDSNGQKPDRDLKGNRLEVNGTKKKHKDLGRDDFVPADRKILDDIATYYGFSEDFPKDQYMIRACGEAKVLYYIGKSVKENFIDKGIQKRVTIINSGVKGFVRNNKDTEGTYRISQEGVHFLVPYMAKRKIVAETEDFTRCLDGNGKPIELSEFSEEFSDAARSSAVGSLVVLLKGYENDLSRKMILTMWRCRGDKINCLVSKVEIDGMRSKLAAIKEEKASSS